MPFKTSSLLEPEPNDLVKPVTFNMMPPINKQHHEVMLYQLVFDMGFETITSDLESFFVANEGFHCQKKSRYGIVA